MPAVITKVQDASIDAETMEQIAASLDLNGDGVITKARGCTAGPSAPLRAASLALRRPPLA